jgi:PadR family transcriptional regulator, regulatory protein PadR
MVQSATANEAYENLASELRRGVLVLAVLRQCREQQYGYSLKQRLGEVELDINEGTLYPLLRRLESQGLLASSWEVTDDQRPRRYYGLSAVGEVVLSRLDADWQALVDVLGRIAAGRD